VGTVRERNHGRELVRRERTGADAHADPSAGTGEVAAQARVVCGGSCHGERRRVAYRHGAAEELK
jgi:hypothetical protein